jgi:hypothetical protein
LIEGIQKNADNTDNPYLRVWARFIIELGKNSNFKYDIANGASIGQINLDAIQHLLIFRRLYGDFWATAEKFKNEKPPTALQNQPDSKFEKASFALNSANNKSQTAAFGAANADEPKQNERCRMDGDAPTILDGIAATLGFGWEEMLDKMANSSDTDIKKMGSGYKAFMSAANILLVYAKFIHTYAALETTITAEDNSSLIRTKNTIPGARRKLRAFVRMNIGEWQTYQCLRTAMNIMTGLDFATLNDGPLGGVGVQWGLTQGGAGDFYSNSGGINQDGEQIVGFASDNPKRIQDKGVGAGRGLGNLTFNKTDDKGITEIILEGTPQRNAKLGKLNQIHKKARVTTSIEIKSGELKGDSVDVYGQVLGGIPGLITMPAELLYRTSWAAGGSLIVPVIDWEECTGDWSGNVTYLREHKFIDRKTQKLVSNRGESTIVKDMDYMYQAQIAVNGGDAVASILAGSKYVETRDTWEMNGCKQMEPMRRMSCSISSKVRTTGTGGGTATVNISVNRNAETYGISIGTPEIQGFTSGEEKGTCSSQCVPKRVKPTNYNYKGKLEGHSFRVPEQKLSASNALALNGSYTQEIAPNVKVTVTWNLRQCGSQANRT